jgi:uncharacterized membrane protein
LRIRKGSGLLPLNLLNIILVVVITFFPSKVLQFVLGIPFVLFFPGYVLMTALFPKKGKMSGIERVVLSFGMSLAVVPLLGLILYYIPWGINLESILYSTASFIFITSIITWVRLKWVPVEERFSLEFQMTMLGWGKSAWDKALSVILALAILGVPGAVGYVIVEPKVGTEFSELYILGLEGEKIHYTLELVAGEETSLTVGIINQERETTVYQVEVRVGGEKNNEVGPIMLEHGQRWEGEVSFIPQIPGENQKVEFLLYKNGEDEPYVEPLRLWVDVTR